MKRRILPETILKNEEKRSNDIDRSFLPSSPVVVRIDSLKQQKFVDDKVEKSGERRRTSDVNR